MNADVLNLRQRPRRLRENPFTRDLAQEVHLDLRQLIQPYFLTPKPVDSEPIDGFTGVSRWSIDGLSRRIERDLEFGVRTFLLFGAAHLKDATGSEASSVDSVVARALPVLRKRFGKNALLMTDVCLCPYTSHGHCGLMDGESVHNDSSIERIADMALCHAQAGADFVAPSDMMDGRVGNVRDRLDAAGFQGTGILAYTAKYASNYYGPFREALSSSPQAGSAAGADRSTYQMDYRSTSDALRELHLDLEEGADLVMVKPALAYLDIISLLKKHSTVPVLAYSVSGEYEMVKQLAKAGLADERKLALENLYAIRRAGAHAVITYFASEIAEKGWLK